MDDEELRAYCMSLPGAHEDVKWGDDLCWCVGGKMFAVTGLETDGLTFKATPLDFEELVTREGITPARYVGRFKWVSMDRLDRLDADELKALVRQSYDLVVAKLPAKVRKGLAG